MFVHGVFKVLLVKDWTVFACKALEFYLLERLPGLPDTAFKIEGSIAGAEAGED